MKVICVSSNGIWERLPLTIGKIYDVLKIENVPFSPSRYDDPSFQWQQLRVKNKKMELSLSAPATPVPFYRIICDNGEIKHIEADKFRDLTLAEKRELKLNELL